ncbi:MAG TPA: 2OG-Fe(II) oxygenase [Thermoanaerobaculia bacterium]|nr:2OG-Fe(II) oxygenase [Thermoanaerobaculia bacterium]
MSDLVATRAGIRIHADSARVSALREEFATRHVLRLPRFLDAELLERARREIAGGTFIPREDEGIAVELNLPESRALDLLLFAMHSPALFAFIRSITSCESIGGFTGRIYRFDPHTPHHDSWHDDTAGGTGDRLIGFSLNLGSAYRGGVFQLRRKEAPEEIVEIANTGEGDAFLFRIARELEHRVTPVIGEHAKTAFAGWFRAGVFDPRALFAEATT